MLTFAGIIPCRRKFQKEASHLLSSCSSNRTTGEETAIAVPLTSRLPNASKSRSYILPLFFQQRRRSISPVINSEWPTASRPARTQIAYTRAVRTLIKTRYGIMSWGTRLAYRPTSLPRRERQKDQKATENYASPDPGGRAARTIKRRTREAQHSWSVNNALRRRCRSPSVGTIPPKAPPPRICRSGAPSSGRPVLWSAWLL